MRDENGFKMHTQSESHVRQMLVVGEDPKKFIKQYSHDFKRDFLQLLRTAHGEKKVNMNHFYQEYIANKEHIHMNATEWPSLTEFAKYLGREGLCRVEEDEKGLQIAWVDNSPEALRRQDAIRKKERQDRGDEERERAAIRQQVRRAKEEAEREGRLGDEVPEKALELKRQEGEKIKLSFGAKLVAVPVKAESPKAESSTKEASAIPAASNTPESDEERSSTTELPKDETPLSVAPGSSAAAPAKISMKMGMSSRPKNVFAAAKKNTLGGKKAASIEQPKKMSEAERIMKEEIERNARKRNGTGFSSGPNKKPKF